LPLKGLFHRADRPQERVKARAFAHIHEQPAADLWKSAPRACLGRSALGALVAALLVAWPLAGHADAGASDYPASPAEYWIKLAAGAGPRARTAWLRVDVKPYRDGTPTCVPSI
jgi:hypothetical protein